MTEVAFVPRSERHAADMARVSKDMDEPIQPGEFLDDISPEAAEKLFKAIVLETFKDACTTIPEPIVGRAPKGWKPSARSKAATKEEAWARFVEGHNNRRREALYDRDNARHWLLTGGVDFDRICSFAGWEPEYIRRGAKKLQALGWPSNAAESVKAMAA